MFESGAALFNRPLRHRERCGVVLYLHKIIIDLEEATGDHMLDGMDIVREHIDAQETAE